MGQEQKYFWIQIDGRGGWSMWFFLVWVDRQDWLTDSCHKVGETFSFVNHDIRFLTPKPPKGRRICWNECHDQLCQSFEGGLAHPGCVKRVMQYGDGNDIVSSFSTITWCAQYWAMWWHWYSLSILNHRPTSYFKSYQAVFQIIKKYTKTLPGPLQREVSPKGLGKAQHKSKRAINILSYFSF